MINAPKEITSEELRAIKLADAERTMTESYPAWPKTINHAGENIAGGLVDKLWTTIVVGMFVISPLVILNEFAKNTANYSNYLSLYK